MTKMKGNENSAQISPVCEDGDLCVCDNHGVPETVTRPLGGQESDEEIPLLPEKVISSVCSRQLKIRQEDYVEELKRLKLQVQRKRQSGIAEDNITVNSSYGAFEYDNKVLHDGPDHSESVVDEVNDDVTSICSINKEENMEGKNGGGKSGSATCRASGAAKKRKSRKECVERKSRKECVERKQARRKSRDIEHDLTDGINKESSGLAAAKETVSEESADVDIRRSPRKRAKHCQEDTNDKKLKLKMQKGCLGSRTNTNGKQSECSSESNATYMYESSYANKIPAKRNKKQGSKTDKACKNSRSRSLENKCDVKEDLDINVGYDLKFPSLDSPEKDESQPDSASWLNMSLPTPTGGLTYTQSCDDFPDLNSVSMAHDFSSSDSDDDLPEGLTPIRCNDKVLAVEDLVWAKFRTSFYIPAIVKTIYKKKRRLTVVFFTPEDHQEKPMTMTYKCVLPFLSSRKDELMEAGERLTGKDREYFKLSIDRLEDFLSKRVQKQLKNGDVWSFFKPEELEFIELEDEDIASDKSDVLDRVETQKVRSLSKRGKLRKAQMSAKSKPLTDFLISDTTKEYLKKIFLEQVPSDLHKTFKTGTVKERMKMKHRGFGPIDDESQIESVLNTYLQWLQEWNKSPYLHKVNYIFDVWVPEAVVNALVTMKTYSKKRAWEMFDKGVRRSKEELQLIHEELLQKTDDSDMDNTPVATFKAKKLILK